MRVVVDTSVLFSFFRATPVKSILADGPDIGVEFFVPEYGIDELWGKREKLRKYCGLSYGEIDLLFLALRSCVKVKPKEFFDEFKEQSFSISPDPFDAPFFALALKLEASIWSNDVLLKKQSEVPVLSTSEMRKLLGV